MDSKLRVAIIGAGRMGRRHIQAVRELGHSIVGVADPSKQSLDLARSEQGITEDLHFLDSLDLLQKTNPECVIIGSTAPSHAPLTCAAAKLGARYILCEKPMATSLAECDLMLETCSRTGTYLAINHQMRFMDTYLEPKRLLDEAGGVVSIQSIAGNMGLVMNGTHMFEMVNIVMGERLQEVTAWLSPDKVPNPRGAEFNDNAGCVFGRTFSGKRFFLECSAELGHGVKSVYSARYGQVFVDELAGFIYSTIREESYRSLPTTRYGMPGINIQKNIPGPDMVHLSKLVLSSLLSNTNFPNGEDGRAAVAAAVAAIESHERGHIAVKIDHALPKERKFPWA